MGIPLSQLNQPPANGICTYLGLLDDPQTSLAIPSPLNYCYHARPPEPVRRQHQRLFCQTSDYARCPVYRSEKILRLPVEIRGLPISSAGERRRQPARMIPVLLIVLILIGALLATRGWISRALSSSPLLSPTPTAIPTSTAPPPSSPAGDLPRPPPNVLAASATDLVPEPASPLPAGTPTRTPTTTRTAKPTSPGTATLTPSPTPTSSPIGQCGHELEQVFGTSRHLLMHRVTGGESLNTYADRYYTTIEVMEAINYDLYIPIYNGSILVIAPGLRQTGVLPPFETYEVPAPGLTLQALAGKVGVSTGSLLQYNDFGADCRNIVSWVLVPREDTATP
jgi:hypothetical protein